MEHYGWLCLLPSAFLLAYVFTTKRVLEGLVGAALIGFIIVGPGTFFQNFVDSSLTVMMNESIGWVILVCGLMGSLIALIEKAGGAKAFGDWIQKRAKGRKSSLFFTWILGIVIFIDDYLNALTVGSCMTEATDKHKVSREMLSYIVDSTAAPVCVIVPISTWAAFVGVLLEENGLAPAGEGLKYYIKSIPYMYYGWIAALIVPLVIFGIVPIIGRMKKAEKRAQETGVLAPPGSEKIDIKGGKTGEEMILAKAKPRMVNFFVPLAALIAATIIMDVDLLKGVYVAIFVTGLLYIPQKIMNMNDFMDAVLEGIKNMLFPLILVVGAFLFAEANHQLGLVEFVLEKVAPIMSPQLLPAGVFLVLGATEFIGGTSWGLYVIGLPIVIPLSFAVGADPILGVAAVISAGTFGSHCCFYSDATILSSAATGCNNFDHAISQMPYALISAGLALILFLVTGFIMA